MKKAVTKRQTMTRWMVQGTLGLSTVAFVMSTGLSASAAQTVKSAAKLQGAFYTGQYPDLFVSDLHQSKRAVQAKIHAAWNQLFHGDKNTQTVYYALKPGMAYIYDTGNLDVRTEGMGYGMMIAVELNHKKEFNALWKFAKTKMQNTLPPYTGYFAWHTDNMGDVLAANPATDGDSWIVTALLFASGRWGNGKGIDNYETQAKQILHNMLHHPTSSGASPMFDPKTHLPVFVPDSSGNTFTDPSYNLPAFYRIWALADPKDARAWNASVKASEAFFKKAANPKTGLTPDYAQFDGKPYGTPGAGGHADFEYDAWRTIANASLDWSWYKADPWEQTYANTLEAFFAKQNPDYVNTFTLSGKPTGQSHSPGLVAMNAASALAATSKGSKQFVQALWDTSIPTGQYRYYDGMLYMLGLLYDSGEFRVWYPRAKA